MAGNSKLTTTCGDELWQGVEVWGDPNISLHNNKGLNTALYQSNYQQNSTLQVFDLGGRFITEQKLTHGQLIVQFDASRWAPGMYLLRLVYRDKTVGSAKVVK